VVGLVDFDASDFSAISRHNGPADLALPLDVIAGRKGLPPVPKLQCVGGRPGPDDGLRKMRQNHPVMMAGGVIKGTKLPTMGVRHRDAASYGVGEEEN
jgi:hypothetical protein